MLVRVYSTTLQLKFSTFRRRSNLFKKLVDRALNKKVSSLIFRKYKRLIFLKLVDGFFNKKSLFSLKPFLNYEIIFSIWGGGIYQNMEFSLNTFLKIELKAPHRLCPHAPLPLK